MAQEEWFHGLPLTQPDVARGAQARGDTTTARKLAQQVVDAWGAADIHVPAVEPMKRLLAEPK